jgi:hypothetical protein
MARFSQIDLYSIQTTNTIPIYNKKLLTFPIFLKCNICGYMCMCVHVTFSIWWTPNGLWFQHVLSLDVSSFITQGPYWSLGENNTLWSKLLVFLLIFENHVHKTFPFCNHKMGKKLDILFLGRLMNHNKKHAIHRNP